MRRGSPRILFFALAVLPFIFACAQQNPTVKEPNCEDVYKSIQVFKGIPASDLIPSMEFMAASLKYECEDCHDPKDYAAENETKTVARKMVLMQRDINAKNFNGRNEVTCMTCHGGKRDHPASTPIPVGIALKHPRLESPPKPEELFARHIAAVGKPPAPLVRVGTLAAPNDGTHKMETLPLEFIQAPGGKFKMVSGDRKILSNGKQVSYGGYPMTDEPAAIFGRMGRSWRGDDAFAGLERLSISGRETIGKTGVVVVRGTRPSTVSTEELSFDTKSNLLVRLVNLRRSSLGTVVSAVDYSNYKKVDGVQVPMKVVVTYADGTQWIMDFRTARFDPSVTDTAFSG